MPLDEHRHARHVELQPVPLGCRDEPLERGRTLDEFLEQFPTVSCEQAVAILGAAKVGMLTLAAGM